MKNSEQYGTYNKPSWAPPSWLFAPVWTALYVVIAISFGYVAYLFATGVIVFSVLLPFILNLAANVLYTPLQFTLRNYLLASIDILVVWGTIIECMVMIFHTAPWVVYVNIPYFLWVSFATVLQFTIWRMNRESKSA